METYNQHIDELKQGYLKNTHNLTIMDESFPARNDLGRIIFTFEVRGHAYIGVAMKRHPAFVCTEYHEALLSILADKTSCSYLYQQPGVFKIQLFSQRRPTNAATTLHFGRFIYLFHKYFCQYQNRAEPVLSFLADIKMLTDGLGGHIDHANGDKCNNCIWNLSLMTKQQNQAKGSHIAYLFEPFQAYTTVTDDGYLIEYDAPAVDDDIITHSYYRCATADDLVDWQLSIMSRTEATRDLSYVTMVDGEPVILTTPKIIRGLRKAQGKANGQSGKRIEEKVSRCFAVDVERRDYLLSRSLDDYIQYSVEDGPCLPVSMAAGNTQVQYEEGLAVLERVR